MFMYEIKKSSHLFSDKEREWLISILDEYAKLTEGNWLNDVEYHKCEYFWCDAMNCDNGVLGARPLFGYSIYLAAIPNKSAFPEVVKDWIASMASTAIHELRHLWQQGVYGKLLWSILRLPEVFPCLYGKVLIERDAISIEEKSQKEIEKIVRGKLN